jgi:hypothetical protein
MAKNAQLSNATVNAQAEVLASALDNGYCRVYDGSQPANADTAVSTQTLLAEIRFAATAESDITAGVITFAAMTVDSSADATGTASWYRALSSDGTTVVMDGSVGTSNANMVLGSVGIQAGAEVRIDSFTHTIAKATAGS